MPEFGHEKRDALTASQVGQVGRPIIQTLSMRPEGRVSALYDRRCPAKFPTFRLGLLRFYAKLVMVVLVSGVWCLRFWLRPLERRERGED